jgi:hypothetical protein
MHKGENSMKIDEVLIELAEELMKASKQQISLADASDHTNQKIIYLTTARSLNETALSVAKVARKALE